MNKAGKYFVILLLLLLFMHLVSAAAGYESLFYKQKLSRGMTLYTVALVLLLAIPLLNRHLKTLMFFFIAFFLSRSFMRITDEQDPVRFLYSIPEGLRLGLMLALVFVGLSLLLLTGLNVLKRIKAVPSFGGDELLYHINNGKRQGKSLEQIRNELIDQGVKKEDFDNAVASLGVEK